VVAPSSEALAVKYGLEILLEDLIARTEVAIVSG
jgi:hypothetical protein